VTGHLVGKTTILSRLKVAWKYLEYLVAFLVSHFLGTEDADGTECAECAKPCLLGKCDDFAIFALQRCEKLQKQCGSRLMLLGSNRFP